MFTGIISDVGVVRRIDTRVITRLEIETRFDPATIELGASIACSGVCLTVVERARDAFAVEVSSETLARTTIGDWRVGRHVNLERSLRAGDEMGGHLVFGHVDGVARIADIEADGQSRRYTFALPGDLPRFVAVKGSIALDGVSLTVNGVEGDRCAITMIPHTLAATSFATAEVGDRVNVEIDMLARYVARLLELR